MQNCMPALLLLTALAIGCGGATGDPVGLNEGTLEVVATTTGINLDPDGYTLSVDGGTPRSLPSNGADTVASLSIGTHTITLAGVASNCLLGGENPRTVEIAVSGVTSLQYHIACSQPPGIFVSAATTGEELDPDGYEAAVDGGVPEPLEINGSVRIGGLAPGEHDVALLDVADNCVVAGNNPLRVVVPSGSTATADFTVSCSAVPPVPPSRDIAFDRDGEVYLLSADGATLTNLSDDPSSDADPAWSPDGQTIAFSSDRSGSSQVFLMNADGSGQSPLTSDGARHPAWSPDGAKIAFMSSANFETDIFVMNADGSDVTQLTTASGIDANPDWSPDGTKIAFNSDRSGERHIHVMNADGTEVTQLTTGNSFDIAPAWSPDGEKIAFYSTRTGTARLYMMNPDGTEQVPLTPSSFSAMSPAWRP